MKIIIYMAQTLNGFIAKNNGETPWSDESWESYSSVCSKYPAMVLGKTTFDLIQEDPSEWDSIGNPFVVVVSSKPLNLRGNFASATSPKEAINILESKGFESVVIGGGAKTNSSFLSLGLVNGVIIDLESKVFSEGMPFIDSSVMKTDIKLKLQSVKKVSDNLAQLRYLI